MSDIISALFTLIGSGIFAVLGLYVLKKSFDAFADYLEQRQHFNQSAKMKKKVILFYKKQANAN